MLGPYWTTKVQRLVLILPLFSQSWRSSPESAAGAPGVNFAKSNWDFLVQLKWIPYEDQQAVLHQRGRCQISLSAYMSSVNKLFMWTELIRNLWRFKKACFDGKHNDLEFWTINIMIWKQRNEG